MAKNPPWTRDELILALALYFKVGRRQVDPAHPEILALSALLNELPIHGDGPGTGTFRNPTGVSMKLGNFLTHDPEYPGQGLSRGNKLEEEVWKEYADHLATLRKVAASIVAGRSEAGLRPSIDPEEEFSEGQVLTRLHHARERNRKAVARKKAAVLQETGRLVCEVCEFDFLVVYGELGRGYAECHHTVPLGDLPATTTTRLSELAILCANCHRMIHRTKPLMALYDFQSLVALINGGMHIG